MQNILNDLERENKGLDTQLRFNYQADWAISYIFEKMLAEKEFVVFMEYHEDIIVSNAKDITPTIEFEFFQIKTTSSNFTIDNLCKFTSPSNSILGKMILSIDNKFFKKNVKKLSLLSVSDFNLDITKIKIMGQSKYLSDLDKSEIDKIASFLSSELSNYDISYHNILCFEKSKIPFESSHIFTKGKILEFIDARYGDIKSNISSIYRAIWDDLKIKYDFLIPIDQWEECVQKRGVKSDEISKILSSNVSIDISQHLKKFINNYLLKMNTDSDFIPIYMDIISKYNTYLITNRSGSFQSKIELIRETIILPNDLKNFESYLEPINYLSNEINKDITLTEFNRYNLVATYEVLKKVYEKLTT